MAGLTETLASDTARRAEARVTDDGYFGEMTEPAELETAKAPLVYVAEGGELGGMELQVERQRQAPVPRSILDEARSHARHTPERAPRGVR